MIIDRHGAFTTVPAALGDDRSARIAGKTADLAPAPQVPADAPRAGPETKRLRRQEGRGRDIHRTGARSVEAPDRLEGTVRRAWPRPGARPTMGRAA